MLTDREIRQIAREQAYYERKDLSGVSQEMRNARTISNFWTEGEEELAMRPTQKIPKEQYDSQKFRQMVREQAKEIEREARRTPQQISQENCDWWENYYAWRTSGSTLHMDDWLVAQARKN